MANLTPTAGWDGIPQLETVTPALAGAAGPMNTQAQALLNRSEQLKSDLTALAASVSNVDNTSDASKPVSTATQTALDTKAPKNNPTFTGTVLGIDKTMVGLGNVDNTSDLSKPVSNATQIVLNTKAPLDSPAFSGTVTGITKTMVGLGNVDNTSDSAKPVSTPQQNALNAKANKAGDTFTGAVTATQFNGSGAGLTGTAASLTAGGANAVNGISGWTYTNSGANPAYIWCTDGAGNYQHLTTPASLSVNYANSAGSAGSIGGAIGTGGGTFTGDVGSNGKFISHSAGEAFYADGYNVSGGINFNNFMHVIPTYDFIMSAQHNPGNFAQIEFQMGGAARFQFDSGGQGRATSGWTTFSDRRLKTDLVIISDALDKVDALTGYTYLRTDTSDEFGNNLKRQAGLIAQDVQSVLPEVVSEAPDGFLTLNYDAVVPLLVNAIKELRAEVKALSAKLPS